MAAGLLYQVVNPDNAQAVVRDFLPKPTFVEQKLSVNRSNFTVQDFKPGTNGLQVRLITVDKLNHAWSGANLSAADPAILGLGMFDSGLPFFAKVGPNATDLIWRFFAGEQTSFPGATVLKEARYF
jgi:poly(3-hydroxybutyrate) depolymerase